MDPTGRSQATLLPTMAFGIQAAVSGYHLGRMTTDPRGSPPVPAELTTTIQLLSRAQNGDDGALNALFDRCLPPLRRWARGRLPRYTRDVLDTQDLVQETVIKTLRHLREFEVRHEGALQAYLREAVVNRIRDEIRKKGRRPPNEDLDENQPDPAASPLDHAIGREQVERYEAALARLRPAEREAIIGRIELQYDYAQLAEALGKPSPDAARVAVKRALSRLIEEMNRAV
jgi:RNA polymerase sigma-70 factor (ECF subfamily)